MNAVYGGSIAEAIGAVESSNYVTQLNCEISLLDVLESYFSMTQGYSEILAEDNQDYYIQTLLITPENPEQAAVAATSYQQYVLDSDQMDKETNHQNEMIQRGKSELQSSMSATSNAYKLELPITNLELSLENLIQKGA